MQVPGYSIQRVIGKGGMATVYLAIQESLSRPVVLKVLDQVSADRSEDLIERFISEGRIIASLHHPNIITIYDIGIADNVMYISMEYVEGGDLKQRMELPLSTDEALDYLRKVATALGEAHRHGIVHRDVKPANILFRDEHTPLLTDFGIAKQVDTEHDLTSTGIFLGSPNYVSPEQADGKRIDGRADIYSLGCIFFEMITGRKPYVSDSIIDIVIQHKQAPVPQLPKEHADLQPLLDRMMAKKRDERFADAGELIREIEKAQQQQRRRAREMGLATPGDETVQVQRRDLRNKQILGGLLLLGLVMFSSLKYVEVRIKGAPVRVQEVSTQTALDADMAPPVATPAASAPATAAAAPAAEPAPGEEEVRRALAWLGRQSLEEYKLTYPPKDNAYYYFSRLLELEPGNPVAIQGMLEISERYLILAEQAMARNEPEKAAAYVDIGLRINPGNTGLRAMKELVASTNTSLLATIKGLFKK
jgi:tRNA A-37 threonylcarbamoyl transferase component Bud32